MDIVLSLRLSGSTNAGVPSMQLKVPNQRTRCTCQAVAAYNIEKALAVSGWQQHSFLI
jgi:hypothetical protein